MAWPEKNIQMKSCDNKKLSNLSQYLFKNFILTNNNCGAGYLSKKEGNTINIAETIPQDKIKTANYTYHYVCILKNYFEDNKKSLQSLSGLRVFQCLPLLF